MSQGARGVVSMAITTPAKVSCVMLDGPPNLLRADAEDSQVLERYRGLAHTYGMSEFRREWINDPLMRLISRDPAAQLALQSMVGRYPGKDLATRGVRSESSLQVEQLQSLQIPTLVLTGAQDAAPRVESANEVVRLLPQAERAIIPNAGHLPNLDNPSQYNEALGGFLARHALAAR